MQWELFKNETWMHHINPSLKLLGMIALFISLLFIHNINIMVYLTAFLLLVYLFLTGQSYKLKLILLIPFFFLFFTSAISMIFFGKGNTTWWQFGLIHITEESFYRGVHLGLRSLSIAFIGLIFALTTKPVFLFYSLMQQWKLSPKYAYSFMAGFRLLPMIAEEYLILRKALLIRGVEQKNGVKTLLKKVYYYSIPLLSQSIRRAHRIAVAMEAKRFNQKAKRTFYYELSYSLRDGVFVLLFVMVLGIATYLGIHYPYIDSTNVRY
ncbi:energy-coupling factor transporter transmembrane component T family protein [Sutcliffiella rhizosphaerae]|uniref:HMP/thiamine permease protein YkoC n=1 Tax=Sutcliffiella rhizosphaerae TaxID=2880967 RepID=A0ABM8YRG3_9BACI|nr:energy-coupling factor transporter transmembrane component T [Sutcliffiella rhizosphaerae]CAG9622589.1 Putative HMP/thiamine permease protein YkoC [Sutcliffiella rhizosphaerae]